MATACHCGCGREVDGLRQRANNEIAKQMVQHLAVMRGALRHGEAGSRVAETQAMADDGAKLLTSIRQYLHGEAERDDLDKGGNKEWLKRGGRLAEALLESAGGPAWEPEDPRTDHLALAGERTHGVMSDVRKHGMGNDRTANLAVTVSASTADGIPIELGRTLSIAVVKAPRIGDAVDVAYDPSDMARFVYRPRIDPAPPPARPSVASEPTDRIGKLRELADMFEQGLLTRAEFDAEKQRLLAD